MPTIPTHAVAGAGIALAAGPCHSTAYIAIAAALGALPDVDVVGFYLGVPYYSFWGHRGVSHAFSTAFLVSLLVAFLTAGLLPAPWWWLWISFFLAMASHSLLDGCTNGGLGVAYFLPLDGRRYFLPWRPIQVSVIGLDRNWARLRRVLTSELQWVWLPVVILVTARFLVWMNTT
jgi:inner membrane protein